MKRYLIPILSIAVVAITMVPSSAQYSSILVRSEITEQSPKMQGEFVFIQTIPMVAGEMVVIFAKTERGYRDCYRRFTPKEGKKPVRWASARGSTWLLQGTDERKAKATPGKGGSPFAFTMRPSDQTMLHVADADGILEVMIRSNSPIPFFFLMGKAKVGPAKVFKEGNIEPTDPWLSDVLGNVYRYHECPYPGKKGAGLIVELRRPDTDPEKDGCHNLGIVTPAGQTLKMDNLLDDVCARVFIGSMTDGKYIIQPRAIGSKLTVEAEKLERVHYVVTTREVPDLLKLLGIEFVADP